MYRGNIYGGGGGYTVELGNLMDRLRSLMG